MCYSALVRQDLKFLQDSYGATSIRREADTYDAASRDYPKLFKPRSTRIYPGYFAPIILWENGQRVMRLMRYGAYPPPYISHPNRYTTYNARRDNLSSPFWSEAFSQGHGFLVLQKFYEWVQVSDLLKAGTVSLAEVEQVFVKMREDRRQSILEAGKKYRPTAIEAKNALQRRIVIEFAPESGEDLLVPVIYSRKSPTPSVDQFGFAIVTDDPPLEVQKAGHDRCPIVLTPHVLDRWLRPFGQSPGHLDDLLSERPRVHLVHRLDRALGRDG